MVGATRFIRTAFSGGLTIFKQIRSTISGQLITAILVVSSVVTLFITAIQLSFDYYEGVNEIQQNLDLIERSHLDSLTQSMWFMNHAQVHADVSGILGIPGIEHIEIWDEEGRSLVTKGTLPKGHIVSRDYPLVFEDGDHRLTVGHMKISTSLDPVYQRLYKKIFLIFLTQFLKTILVSSLIFLVIHRLLTRHLEAISRFLKEMDLKKGPGLLKLDRRPTPLGAEDELDVLVDSITSMQTNLLRSYQELSDFSLHLEKMIEEKTKLVLDQMQKLEHASKMSALGEMAGGIAHEINNPLTVIRLKAEILEKSILNQDSNSERMQKHVSKIIETTDRIAKIIEGLRFFARDGRYDKMERTSLTTVIDSSLSLCREHFKSHGVPIQISQPNPSLSVFCRPVEISQILINLLSNAFDAVAHESEKWIQIETRELPDRIQIAVIDSGPGVPLDLQQKVMQPFFTTKEVGKGTGLGLSISAGIARAHRGKIFIDTTHPHTCFVLELPKAQDLQATQAPSSLFNSSSLKNETFEPAGESKTNSQKDEAL